MDKIKQIESLAAVFQALGDPTRLGIVKLLISTGHPLCVNAIARESGVTQSAVSQHLKVLRQQGIVEAKKEGYYKHYAINYEHFELIQNLRKEVLGEKLEL